MVNNSSVISLCNNQFQHLTPRKEWNAGKGTDKPIKPLEIYQYRQNMELIPLDVSNVSQLKVLNSAILPIYYSDKFYRNVVKEPKLSRLARVNGKYVGMVCCRRCEQRDHDKNYRVQTIREQSDRVESDGPESNDVQNSTSLYIMTLGCNVLYRRRGIGSALLQYALNLATEECFTKVKLHVQSTNSDAVDFYRKFGFRVVKEIEGYYRYLKPSGALLLEKCLGDGVTAVT